MSPGRNPLWNTGVKDERGDDVFIPVLDAAAYINEEFYSALEALCASESLGCLPFAGGWAEQPEWIVRAMLALKAERRKADEEDLDAERQKIEDAEKYGKRQ